MPSTLMAACALWVTTWRTIAVRVADTAQYDEILFDVRQRGVLGDFFSPTLIGLTRGITGSLSSELQLINAILVVGACIARVKIKRGIAHDVQ
ncbi:hypothetical protein [Burkholderia ubonensis]|uniref:hypothetical protein n=1 Tax=Burkholderia ubonensis TaxID=101571 RepID=UPI0012F9FB29|nr:hypothetical protein [Burkholderia ubonensis]